MDYQYKIIVSNRTIYKEFELQENVDRVRLGTTTNCEFRLNPEYFFAPIELEIEKNEKSWNIACVSDHYISKGDMRKIIVSQMKHGDIFSLRYADSGDEVFEIRFLIDFEAEIPYFNWKIDLKKENKLVIGTDANCDLRMKNQADEKGQMLLKKTNNGWYVSSRDSQYGIQLNGKIITEALLKDQDYITFGGAFFVYKEETLFLDMKNLEVNNRDVLTIEESVNSFHYPLFNRSTRIKQSFSNEKIMVLDPPEKPVKPQENIIKTLIPALVTLALTIVVRGFMSKSSNNAFIIFSVCTMSMGIITTIVGFIDGKKKYKKQVTDRQQKYVEYIEKKKAEISKRRQEELEMLQNTYFDRERELQIVRQFDKDLFDRSVEDEDFLCCYLGKGKIQSQGIVEYKQQEKFESEDELAKMPEFVHDLFAYIEKAPVVLPLQKANAIGIVGEKKACYAIFKNMVLDIAIRHYYADVQLMALIPEQSEKFAWLRLLPHFQNMYGLRSIVYDTESRNNTFENLYKELNRREELKGKVSGTHIAIFVLNEWGIKNHPLSRFLDKAAELHVTFLFFEDAFEKIPQNCSYLVNIQEKQKGELVNAAAGNEKCVFTYEEFTDHEAEEIVRKLAPVYCEQISLESSLRKNISLFELLKIYTAADLNLQERWNASKIYESIAVPLGVNAKDEIVYLNLHEKAHGPHGLVAGTTGSGKSEILQTYILSAASLFHPYEIGFVIIDFKGGGMVNQFKELPHLIGAITNIDGREIDRSLKSIKAELLKRQAFFAAANVNHIDKYIKLYKEGKVTVALPHLVMIVDEFAELKAEQPEFMKELISAARIGRSLGVHLILATQKPSGQVNEQIWSNSKFKLCLKVQTKEDSNEVLKSPLAAEIREPGRAYLQVGNNELFELFQSAYSGGPAVADANGNQKKYAMYELDLAGRRSLVYEKKIEKVQKKQETELEAIVKYISEYCKEADIEKLPGICLPPLESEIQFPVHSTCDSKGTTVVELGIYDDPDSQLQQGYCLDLLENNVAIIGSSQSGKTTLLQTMIRSAAQRYSPNEVSIYLMDFASKALNIFSELNHVGGVVTASEDEKMKHLVRMLMKEMARRKDLFAKMGITSFYSYREAGYRDLRHIVLLIDNFGALKELFPDYEEDILHLLREGISVGITFVVTAMQTTHFGYKYLSNFGARIALQCNEKSEYSNVFDRCRIEPKNVPGRCLITINKLIYECQIYLPFEGKKEIERVSSVKNFVAERNSEYDGMEATLIPEVPAILSNKYLEKVLEEKLDRTYQIAVGMDYEKVEPFIIDLSRLGFLATLGKEKSGKTNFIKNILNSLQKRVFTAPSKIFVFDDYERQLKFAQEYGIVEKYMLGIEDLDFYLKQFEEELMRRQALAKESGIDALADEPLMIAIIRNEEVMTSSVAKPTAELLKRVVKLGKTLKLMIILADIENQNIGFSAGEVAKYAKETKNLFFFDDLSNMKMVDIGIAQARNYKKPIEIGDAYFMDDKGLCKLKTTIAGEN